MVFLTPYNVEKFVGKKNGFEVINIANYNQLYVLP